MISWNTHHRNISGVFQYVGSDKHEHVNLGLSRGMNRATAWSENGRSTDDKDVTLIRVTDISIHTYTG
jgi:hypothetical protein